MTNLEITKTEIQTLGLNAIKEYFNLDINKLDAGLIHNLHNKAKLAMQFEREMCIGKRAIEMNYIRVFKMVAEDKAELKNYIKKSPLSTYIK